MAARGVRHARSADGRGEAAVRGGGHRVPRAVDQGRVLVRTGASPFCSTDCVNWRGELFKIPPTVLGHASMGYVEEVGRGRRRHLKVGDRVIVPGTSECGVCFYCSIGRPDQCSETFDRGGIWPHVADRSNGDPVNAAGNVGGYSEVMNVTANQVWAIESDLPDEVARLHGLRHHDRPGLVFHVAKVQPGPERRGRRPRPPRPVDDPGREARRRRQDHRRRPDRLPPRARRHARRDPRRSTRARRTPIAAVQAPDRGPRRRRRARGRDARVGRRATPCSCRAARARSCSPASRGGRRGDAAAGRDRGPEPRDHLHAERQRAHAQRPARASPA